MIVALEGILESRGVDSAVVKVGPLSLQVYIPSSTSSQLGAVGDKVHPKPDRLDTCYLLKKRLGLNLEKGGVEATS